MPKTVPTILEIDHRKEVLVGTAKCTMEHVPLGKIFVADGRQFQGHVTSILYGRLPVGSRFRLDGKWYKRIDKANLLLDPSTPFADTCKIHVAVRDQQKVDMLEVMDRGPVEIRPGVVPASS